MASITSLKASDGTGNASVATVQSVRSPSATTLVVDTVQGINSSFHATMGTPHTFVDPVTNEIITVISEATAVDFKGHVDGGNLEIDTIAPGFTDAGSAVNDIVIIKPTTQWADQVASVLAVSHDDDGTLKTDIVETPNIKDDAVTAPKIDWASTGANAGIWWEELGRTTLGSAGDTITLSSIPARKYLKIFCMLLQAGSIDSSLRFNNDSGTNYAWNISTDGGANSKSASSTFVPGQTLATANQFIVFEITNLADQAKQVIGNVMNDGAAGAGTAPVRREVVAKWHNTSNQINRIDVFNSGAGDFAIGSELVVLGHN